MPWCSATNCRNSAAKGFRLFLFPVEADLRQKWIANCGREKWEPSNHDKICEIHFDDSQFEANRKGGYKKLLPSAVPTIFPKPAVLNNKTPTKPLRNSQRLTRKQTKENNASAPSETNSSKSEPGQPKKSKQGKRLHENADSPSSSHPQGEENGHKVFKKLKQLKEGSDAMQKNIKQTLKTLASVEVQTTPDLANISDSEKSVSDLHFELLHLKNCLRTVFNEDQMSFLFQGTIEEKGWSSGTIQKAVQTRFVLGNEGYDYLLDQLKLPFPSATEICKSQLNLILDPGILSEVIERLALKLKVLSNLEKDCIISIENMSLLQEVNLGESANSTCKITLGLDKSESASNVLVITIQGIFSAWKQIIAYHFTGSTIEESDLQELVSVVRSEVANTGFRVRGVVSDLEPDNQALWDSFGIFVGAKEMNHVIGKVNKNENNLYFFADATCVLICLRDAFLEETIYLPNWLVKQENLATHEVDVKYLFSLLNEQKEKELTLVDFLTSDHLQPGKSPENNAKLSSELFSDTVAKALEVLIKLKMIENEASSTVWFIRFLHKWYQLMTSSTEDLGLKKDSPSYMTKMDFLERSVECIKHMRFGSFDAPWQPYQTGFILTTNSVLDLQDELITEGCQFILTISFTQESLKKLFPLPEHSGNQTVISMKRLIKAIAMVQLLEPPPKNVSLVNQRHAASSTMIKIILQELEIRGDTPKELEDKVDRSLVKDDSDLPENEVLVSEESIVLPEEPINVLQIPLSQEENVDQLP